MAKNNSNATAAPNNVTSFCTPAFGLFGTMIDLGVDLAPVRERIQECKLRYHRELWKIICERGMEGNKGGDQWKKRDGEAGEGGDAGGGGGGGGEDAPPPAEESGGGEDANQSNLTWGNMNNPTYGGGYHHHHQHHNHNSNSRNQDGRSIRTGFALGPSSFRGTMMQADDRSAVAAAAAAAVAAAAAAAAASTGATGGQMASMGDSAAAATLLLQAH